MSGFSVLSQEQNQMPNRTALQTFGRSGNPMFRRNAFQPDATFDETDSTQRMTLAGAVNKTGILLVLCLGCSQRADDARSVGRIHNGNGYCF